MPNVTFLGPISNNQNVIFLTSIGSTGYFLNGVTGPNNSVSYYWESSLDPIVASNPTVPYFNLSSNNYDATISASFADQVNSGSYLSINNGILSSSNSVSNITLSQSQYAPWGIPFALLSGVDYSIQDGNGNTASIYSDNSLKNTVTAENIIVVPVPSVQECVVQGQSASAYYGNPQEIIASWLCIESSNPPSGCTALLPLPDFYWTQATDCLNSVRYQYCPTGATCGSEENCNGPCSNPVDTCKYNSSNSEFTCSIDVKKVESTWYKDPLIIGVLAGIIGLILVILLVMAIVFFKRKKQ
jgi:hypothetical protein